MNGDMFDIYFDPHAGAWKVRMVRFHLLFITTYHVLKDDEGDDREFSTFDAALAYVDVIGLTRAYSMRLPRGSMSFVEAVNADAAQRVGSIPEVFRFRGRGETKLATFSRVDYGGTL